MPHEVLDRPAGPHCVDNHGRILWPSLDHAMTYANVVAMVRKTRQTVVPVMHLGMPMFHVRKARPKVAEPCS